MSPAANERDDSRDGLSGVPHLKTDGSNWPVFKTRLAWALDAKDLLGHLTGEDPEPVDLLAAWAAGEAPPPSIAGNADAQTLLAEGEQLPLTAKDKKLHEKYLDDLKAWKKREAKARDLLARLVPDTVLRRMKRNGDSVAAMWSWICGEFEDKTPLVQSSTLERFQTLRCGESGNVAKHLDTLGEMVEELSAIGVDISDKDYAAQILRSIPTQYADYLSGMMNAAQLLGKEISPDQAVQFIKQEYERKKLPNKSKSAKDKDERDAAYSANIGGRFPRKGNAKSNQKPAPRGPTCWNCGGKGHRKDLCPSPKEEDGKGSGDGKAKIEAVANTAVVEDSDAEYGWMATVSDSESTSEIESSFSAYLSGSENDPDDNDDLMPELEHVPDSDDEEDFFGWLV